MRLFAIRWSLAVVVVAGAVGAAGAQAAAPLKLISVSQLGREVNLTETEAKAGAALEDICTVESKDSCRQGSHSSIAGGFEYPEGVAAAPTGNIYVADKGNHRIQELTGSGQFVLMFGKGVDQSTGEDLCTAASRDICTGGVAGGAPGQFSQPHSIAVDPKNGDVYVAEGSPSGDRVQKLTAEGTFILEIGKEVNETRDKEPGASAAQKNLCTRQEELTEAVKCIAPSEQGGAPDTPEPGSFDFSQGKGDLLAVDAAGTLYVGDQGRVQKFTEGGKFAGELPIADDDWVYGLAVDSSGGLYLEEGAGNGGAGGSAVRVFDAGGEEVKSFAVDGTQPGAKEVRILELALDSEGHLAVVGSQQVGGTKTLFGSLYDASSGQRITAFKVPAEEPGLYSPEVKALAFNASGELFAATGIDNSILTYAPKLVAELVVDPATCKEGPEHQTDATLNCTLNGSVNPWGASETEVWFEYGRTCALGSASPKQQIATGSTLSPVTPVAITEVRPDEPGFCYRLDGEDSYVKAPELLTSIEPETTSFTTPIVPPWMGAPSAAFVNASSAVLSAELNPENAGTEYYFEYAPGSETLADCAGVVAGAQCAGVGVTPAGHSSVYGSVGTTLEASSLQPATLYSYRLAARSENTARTETLTSTGSEASFTTAAMPRPSARTGGYEALSATSATISGAVNPDGAAASYSFELGVYEGASTQYAPAFSGPLPAGTAPVTETLGLTGLQPGVTYAYRIAVSSGYIDNQSHTLEGEPVTFTTTGLPAVLAAPPVLGALAVPAIAFPKEPVQANVKKPTRAQELKRALKACARKPRSRRAACRSSARKKYAGKPTKR
jgi:DNA-binding beta-propeller fold protein YncE